MTYGGLNVGQAHVKMSDFASNDRGDIYFQNDTNISLLPYDAISSPNFGVLITTPCIYIIGLI